MKEMKEMKCEECGETIGYTVSTDEEFSKDYSKCPQRKESRQRGCKFLMD